MSAFLVIWPPQLSDTPESLIASLLGCPSWPFGWKVSNSAVRTLSTSSFDSVAERICTVAEPPVPTVWTDWGSLFKVLVKTSWTCCTVAVPCAPATGNDTLVPPSKSMPNVKPRISMLAMPIVMMRPLIVNHTLRLPMTLNAPVPVYSRTRKPCFGAAPSGVRQLLDAVGARSSVRHVDAVDEVTLVVLPVFGACRYLPPVESRGGSPFPRDLLHRAEPVERRLGQCRRLRRQVNQRPRHQVHHDNVEDGHQTRGERKALDLSDGQDVEHHGCQQRDRVTRQNRLAGPRPASWHRRPERSSLAYLVLDAFEEHHERVGRGADADDEAGDACQVERVVDVSAEQHQDRENHCARYHQRQSDQKPECAVIQQRVDQHQRQPDRARDQARPQRRQPQCRRDGLSLGRLE